MYVTPATWFPSTHMHGAWLSEACAVMVGVAIFALLSSFTAESRGKLTLRNVLVAGTVACLVMAIVLWLGPLNDYPNDQYNTGYWAQQDYIVKMAGSVLRHVFAAVGLAAVPPMLNWSHDHWRRHRELGFWLATAMGLLGGLAIVAGAIFLNF